MRSNLSVRGSTLWIDAPIASLVYTLPGIRRTVRPRFVAMGYPAKYAYDWAGVVAVQAVLIYGSISFSLLDWSASVSAYTALYFFGHIACAVGFAIIIPLGILWPPPPRKAKSEGKSEGKSEAKTT